MTIRKEYFEYLRHLGNTEPVSALHSKKDAPNLVVLRHDVDHDLDIGLEMAYWEAEYGYRATYFLLHSADYWNDSRFIDKCLQLQDFGHEVGLHLNMLTRWFTGEIDDVADAITSLVKPLKQQGVRITGVSAHGDRACYKYQFSNYWCFRDLKPADPALRETGLSAEGISPEDPKHALQYPASHQLQRADGATFPLWSIGLKECGLVYDAMHVPFDDYFTDSGGSWLRSPDPMTATLKSGRHQVLFHPVHWLGKARQYFFLSTARSGSTWLARVLDEASSVHARHEYALNHYFDGIQMLTRKETGAGFTQLLEQREKVVSLLADLRMDIEHNKRDYAEVNVYLEQFIPELKQLFPEATLVQLARHPADIVRSIMNRDWYTTPDDNLHPKINRPTWKWLPQFDKCCIYVADVMLRLSVACPVVIRLEDIATNKEQLKKSLQSVGIAFYPRLAEPVHRTSINNGQINQMSALNKWNVYQRWRFWQVCGFVVDQFYSDDRWRLTWRDYIIRFLQYPLRFATRILRKTAIVGGVSINSVLDVPGVILVEVQFNNNNDSNLRISNLNAKKSDEALLLTLVNPSQHGYMTLGHCPWRRINSKQGWPVNPGRYYELLIDAEVLGRGEARVIALCFGNDFELRMKKNLAYLRPHSVTHPVSYRAPEGISRIDFAIYLQKDQPQLSVNLKGFRLIERSLVGRG